MENPFGEAGCKSARFVYHVDSLGIKDLGGLCHGVRVLLPGRPCGKLLRRRCVAPSWPAWLWSENQPYDVDCPARAATALYLCRLRAFDFDCWHLQYRIDAHGYLSQY